MTLLRLRAATEFGITVDEAHYVLYGKWLDWSYFDHPPLVGWVQALFQQLPVSDLLQARLAPLLISIWTSKLIYDFLLKHEFTDKQSLWSVIALNLTPMYNIMSIVLLPDTVLMPLTLLTIHSTEKILKKSNTRNWIFLGLLLGLSALSKYTAILFVLSLVIVFVFNKKISEILTARFWWGVLVAGIFLLPIIYWNIQHDWISFKYQTDHVLTDNSAIFKNFAASLAMQSFSWGIAPFLISIFFFINSLRRFAIKNSLSTLQVFLSVFLVFFVYISKNEPLLPHWMLIFFFLAIPLVYSELLKKNKFKKTLIVSTALSATLSIAILIEVGFKIFPTKTTAGLYEGVQGWDAAIQQSTALLDSINAEHKGIAVMNWTLGSRAIYYNKSQYPVFVIDNRHDQFDIWNPKSPAGFDMIVILEANKKDEQLKHLNCGQLTAVGEKKSYIKDIPVNHFLYYHCANFKAYR